MTFVYSKEFDKYICEYLLKDYRYTKYNLHIKLKSRNSYIAFKSFLTRVKYLNLLSLSAPTTLLERDDRRSLKFYNGNEIVCGNQSGEYE